MHSLYRYALVAALRAAMCEHDKSTAAPGGGLAAAAAASCGAALAACAADPAGTGLWGGVSVNVNGTLVSTTGACRAATLAGGVCPVGRAAHSKLTH
jgi:hypothetical protein